MFDSHTHGFYSYDSDADYHAMILSAVSKGLDGICFTDHYEYVPDLDKFCGFDMNEYLSEIRSFSQNKSYGNFKILTGAEFGLYDTNSEKISQALNDYKFDSVIGSVHYVIGCPDPYYQEYTATRSKFEAYSAVLKKYIELLPKYPQINIIGHFDYVSRYSKSYADRNMYYKDFADYFDKLLTIIINMGISLEVNTSTYAKHDEFPANILDINILKRYKELGGEMISIGSDAHEPSKIAQNFTATIEIIKNAGFKFLTHFEQGKPIFDKV